MVRSNFQMPIQCTCKLVVAAKDGTVVKSVDLTRRQTLSIGRSPRCDLSMDLESISRRHATMIFLDGRWTIIDTDSKSGFKIDNQNVDVATLEEDRPIQLGGAFFWLQSIACDSSRFPGSESSPSSTLWLPSDQDTGKVSLTIMDLDARPLHQISAEGELTTIGSSNKSDYCIPIQDWAPVQLAVIQSESGTSVLDVAHENKMRFQGQLCRRWSKKERSLIRCGDQLIEIEIEPTLHERVSSASDEPK
jgi:hypothetical protein